MRQAPFMRKGEQRNVVCHPQLVSGLVLLARRWWQGVCARSNVGKDHRLLQQRNVFTHNRCVWARSRRFPVM